MNRIKEVLDKKGIKQTWLAEMLGKSYNMVNSYVKNRRQPSLDDLFKIAKILGVEAKELLASNYGNEVHNDVPEISSANSTVKIPLVGNIACGAPIFAEESAEAMISVSIDLISQNQKYFILRAQGDSMNEAGINDKDLVLIKHQQVAQNMDLVVALIDDEATIKEFHKNDDMIVLQPRSSNPKHQPIILKRDFKIQGVVEAVIPNVKN